MNVIFMVDQKNVAGSELIQTVVGFVVMLAVLALVVLI
jgi:hypothetical protein